MTDLRLVDAGPMDVIHQVALDAAQLELVDRGKALPCWRFWEAPEPAVIIGTGGRIGREVHVDHIDADGVPLVRRVSGGGAVVQVPGVLNYAAILPCDENDLNVAAAYQQVFRILIAALADLEVDVRCEPPSDLAINGRKFSGNAQARKRRAVLVHGTLLISPDISRFDRYLPHPPEEPAYRAGRSHEAFVTTLSRQATGFSAEAVRDAIVWRAGLDPAQATAPMKIERIRMESFVREKFGQDSWNRRK